MTIPATDYTWCRDCEDTSTGHSRICTICGSTLELFPGSQNNSNSNSTRVNNNLGTATHIGDTAFLSPIPDHMRDDLRESGRELRQLVTTLRQQQQHQEEEVWQQIPAALLDPQAGGGTNDNGSASTGRGTAKHVLKSIARIVLEESSSIFRQATLQVRDGTTHPPSYKAIKAIPSEFDVFGTLTHFVVGNHEDNKDKDKDNNKAVLVIADPRTGKGGSLSSTTQTQIDEELKKGHAVVLYMERGDGVTFVQKALLAQTAGASAMVIGNHTSEPWPYVMRDSKGEAVQYKLEIPVVMIKQSDGQDLVQQCQRRRQQQQQQPHGSCPCRLEITRQSKECIICTDSFQKGHTVVRLPACGHVFHDTCALQWLEQHNTCPYCRRELPTDDEDYERERRRTQRTHAGSEGTGSTEWSDFYG